MMRRWVTMRAQPIDGADMSFSKGERDHYRRCCHLIKSRALDVVRQAVNNNPLLQGLLGSLIPDNSRISAIVNNVILQQRQADHSLSGQDRVGGGGPIRRKKQKPASSIVQL